MTQMFELSFSIRNTQDRYQLEILDYNTGIVLIIQVIFLYPDKPNIIKNSFLESYV